MIWEQINMLHFIFIFHLFIYLFIVLYLSCFDFILFRFIINLVIIFIIMLLGLLSDDDVLLPFLFIFFSLLGDSGRVSFVAGLFVLYFYFFLFNRPFYNILVMFYIAWGCCHKNSVLYWNPRNAKTVIQLMMDIIGLFTSLFLSCSTNSYSFSI